MIDDADQRPWDTVITREHGLLDLGLRDLWQYRDLVGLFVRRNFAVSYRQTVLGPLWFLIQPIMTTVVFTLIFGVVANVPTDGIPPSLFYLAGIVMWTNFAGNLTATSDVFAANMALFGKVYFPRLTVPIATVLTSFITAALHLCILVVLCAVQFYRGNFDGPTVSVLFAPLLILANAVLALSFGLIFSALTTRYRDLIPVVSVGVQLWMYASPVVYPLSQVPEKIRILMALNPMSTSLELFRLMVFGEGTVSMWQIVISLAVVLVMMALGLLTFSRAERVAADTV